MRIAKEQIEYWALLAEVIGAIGVIVSVIYLAIQVGESTEEMQAQTHYNALRLAQLSVEMQIVDPGLGELVTRGSRSTDGLTTTEWDRLAGYYFLAFNAWEYSYLLSKSETVSPELWQAHDGYMRSEIPRKPTMIIFWTEYQSSYSDIFRGYVDEIIETAKLN
jgi:hypothetical protein